MGASGVDRPIAEAVAAVVSCFDFASSQPWLIRLWRSRSGIVRGAWGLRITNMVAAEAELKRRIVIAFGFELIDTTGFIIAGRRTRCGS